MNRSLHKPSVGAHFVSAIFRFLSNGRPATTNPITRILPVLSALPLCGALLLATNAEGANPITVENANAGTPASQWDITGAGDLSIQGFATDISVNKGGTVQFKIDTDAHAYRLDIYRLGYYGGLGARFMATVQPSATLPQNQPNPITDDTTGLIDCGNWAVSASWAVPATATSGLYIAKVTRTDTGGACHIPFVVRDDSSTSEMLFQTSDTTWQAYNTYGGNSLYVGNPAGRAYKVSYNRPFVTRDGDTNHDWIFNAEYPMIRWLESNGYNVTYTTGLDSDRRGNLIQQHKIFLSVGHDEYWSGAQRTNVEAARAAGVNLAFFSGNEVFWKTRWENSIDGTNTPYRTLVCYKETHAGARIDPLDTGAANSIWTGTWRDPRFSPPADGGRPENALTGTIFIVNGPATDSITVPASYGAHRFWRNTGVDTLAPGATATMPAGTLGYEWDNSPVNATQPTGLMRLSLANLSGESVLQDYGSTYATGTATHQLTLYKYSSGALVFGAGTIQWPWGLDSNHDGGNLAASKAMQQATVNLFADMKVQPASLQSGLTAAAASTDTTAPTSTISSPANGSSVPLGTQVNITGTATDVGGKVWGVDVSTDGGATWQPATGTTSWTFAFIPWQTGSVAIKTRAFDDSGNLETPAAGRTITVTGSTTSSQSTIWPNTAAPSIGDAGADDPVELGVKFRSDVSGTIVGLRFYKAAGNTGTHVGNLWTSTGTLLASATFTSESASGWQQVNFTAPVAVAPNTEYVASYHTSGGHYSDDDNYFTTHGVDNAPLHAQVSTVADPNGVYAYGTGNIFPNQSWGDSNYWVDVVLQTTATPVSITVSPANASINVGGTQQFTATAKYADNSTQNVTGQVLWSSSAPTHATINGAGLATGAGPGNSTIAATINGISGSQTLTVGLAPLSITTTSLPSGALGMAYSTTLAAAGGSAPYTWSLSAGSLPTGLSLNATTGLISGTPTATGTFAVTVKVTDSGAGETSKQSVTQTLTATISATPTLTSIWPATAAPTLADAGPDGSVEVGVRFRSDMGGTVNGIRFYKAATNTGTHTGSLWSNTGTLLATATFSGETASGWQQVSFSSPVTITANTVYVASYHANTGHYSADDNYFQTAGVDNAPLHALADGVSGANGIFTYGVATIFPNQTWSSSNYWVDIVFQPIVAPTLTSIAVTPATPSILRGTTQQFTATGTYSNSTTQNLTSQVTWSSSATSIATVNSAGLATGVAAGSATITAKSGVVLGTTVLTVTPPPLVITTSALNNGTTNVTYSSTLAATGGTGAFSWSLAVGPLPAGLTLSTAGVISGRPTTKGTSTFTVQVSDSGNPKQIVTKQFTLTVTTTLTSITIAPLTPTLSVAGTQQFAATGHYSDASTQDLTAQATWSSSSTLRATINSAGLATAVATGTATITATSGSISGNTVLTVIPKPPTITTTTLPNGVVSSVYSTTLAATLGTTPYTWSITGALPTGLTLNASTGVISGTPTASGTFSLTVKVTDNGNPKQSGTALLSLTIAPKLNSIAVTPANPTVIIGTPQQFTATGTYSDASVQDLTTQATWTSSVTTKATITSAGLATTLASGTTTISAKVGTVTGTTVLTVVPPPLSMTTPSLPDAKAGTAYSAFLFATGGTTPYTWSVTGSLPNGLTLNPSTGEISGIPTATGTFNFTATATDVSNPVKTASAPLAITVTAPTTLFSIWSNLNLPGLADSGPDTPVELGVKFQADVGGTVTGIRFYKSIANTGTHVGNLWTSDGTLLATATFSDETASGWQQVSFSTPVTINANTIYIASYHITAGHYSADQNFFASAGVDKAPLHALASSVSLNGVYGYGAASVFPNQSYKATNYWVDLVFKPNATLSSLTVTPANPSLSVGGTQQFSATGVYSDASTQDLTGQVTWSSSAGTYASVNAAGRATGLTPGASTITATLGLISGNTVLTVQPLPLLITTATLANATVTTPYSATLVASGGVAPYLWSIAGGALPSGLSLNPTTGTISGTPTASGSFSFTVQVTDSAATPQSATTPFSVSVTAGLASISVTPANPSIAIGATQQFSATGVFTDASTQDLTSQVTWSSSVTARATVNTSGLATAVSGGTTTISAAKGLITGTTVLTVKPATLSITTTSVPNATLAKAYSVTLIGTGGTTPYAWSISTGTLPTGLALAASTGVLSGTPSRTGTYNFTIKLADAGSPVQSATKALTIVVGSTASFATIWSTSTVPGTVDGGPDGAVELGVKFRSDSAGTIQGIRFYKASTNTGTHVGNLWSSTGTLLASATFTGETTSGWQQVNFASPVAITANTVYVASYHVNAGHYSADTSYFATKGVDTPPLHALQEGVSGSDGVYAYGTTSSFPNQTWQSSNYWVDVSFAAAGSGGSGDTTPPTVLSVAPSAGLGGVPVAQPVTLTFSEALGISSVSGTTVLLRDGANALVPASVSYDNSTFTVTLTPTSPLNHATTYALTAKGGAGGIADVSGNPMAADFTSSFATISYGATGNGPGGPILILTDSGHPFGNYLAEILLAEGLNSFQLADISTISSSSLAPFDVVLLGESTLNASQVSALTTWVNGGGHLVAMRPDKQLAGLLGLADAGGSISEGYLQVDTSTAPGTGIVGDAIQFHDAADLYTANGATVVASLFAGNFAPTASPAVTIRSVGSNGGKAAAFAFDLAKSIVYMRQGNPAWIDENRDGESPPTRADDLFFGAAPFDPQPDWINLNKVEIPQGDEEQHLLANLILSMNATKRPLPRFWLFPNGYKAAIVMTGDDHGTTYGGFAGTSGRFNIYTSESLAGSSPNDWSAIRSTSYMFPDPNGGPPTDQQAVAYNAAGFEIALHLNTNLQNYTTATLTQMLTDQLNQWKALFPSLPTPVTHRAHGIAWSGYTIMPEVEYTLGMRLDTTYYYWPGFWVADRPGMFTGSGFPMRFASSTGNVIDVYQAPTQMTDESGQTIPYTVDTLLDNAVGPLGYYGAFVANMHTDFPDESGSDEIVLSAIEHGVPVISARQLLNWTDGRNSSSVTGITWNGTTLGFTVTAAPLAAGLQTMVPIAPGSRVTAVRKNGTAISAQLMVMKGIQYVVITSPSAAYQVDFAADTTPPTVVSVSPVNGATGVSPNVQIVVGFSEALDPATVTGSSLILRDALNNPVAANVSYDPSTFTAIISPDLSLPAQKPYTISIIGGITGVKDVAGNAMNNFSSTFSTGSAVVPVYSLWDNGEGPSSGVNPVDLNPIEVGVKVRSSADGYITGVRFYKTPSNTGSHVGKVWSSTGTLLGSVTFANETKSGWQYQALASPIAITANTTYVVSYHTSTGDYAADGSYFEGRDFENGPLQALTDGADGPNGVYVYGASAFPNQDAGGTNYWVDFTFQTTLVP
jgi:uncharacterized protein YjdB